MKHPLKLLAIAMGIAWLIWVSALLYWMVAPKIFGPEKAVRALHESVTTGMTTATLEKLISQAQNFQTTPISPEGKLHISKLTRDWLCTFSIQIEKETVHSTEDVICID